MKVIKTAQEYNDALDEVEKLMDMDPDEGTPEADKLELLALLIEDYESRVVEIAPPNPIEAIRFRMEQENLIQRDLVPYIGSRSRVSDVLSGRRGLTIPMIRALHVGLGIPLEVLIQVEEQRETQDH